MRKIYLLLAFLLPFVTVFAQQPNKLPPHSRILYFGDSQTSYAYSSSGNSVQYQNYGYVSWVNALAPGAQIPKGGILAVPGETTTQMLNRLGAVAGFNPKLMVVLAGTNDPLYGIGPETTKANLRKIYESGMSAGANVIAITILPRFGQNAYSDANELNRKAINEWIKSQSDVIVVDAEASLNDASLFDDGLHPSPKGAYILGSLVAAEVNNRVAQCLARSAAAADLGVASNANPYLSGTGGTTNTASGVVATSWQLAGNLAGGASVAGAKETDAAGHEKQVITISGNYTGSAKQASFNNYAASPIALVTGDVVEGVAEIELMGELKNIKTIAVKVIAYTRSYRTILGEGNSMFPTSGSPYYMPAGKYLLRTPAITIGSGTVAQLTTQIVIEFKNTAITEAVGASLKVSSIGIRRLPLAAGPVATITPSGTQMVCPGNSVSLTASTGSGYAYQWRMNEVDIPTATGSGYTATEPGSYAVKVTAPGCSVLSDPTILTNGECAPYVIKTGSLPQALCIGQSLNIPFTTSSSFTEGNQFTAQLSDGAGSFADPVTIGTLTAVSSGTIHAVIPTTASPAMAYRIRVVASEPASTGGDNGSDIAINTVPELTSSLAPSVICNNTTIQYTPAGTPDGVTFTWSRSAVPGVANGAATGSGSVAETLQNTTTLPVKVSYAYTISNKGCNNGPYLLEVTVNPSPVVRTKNATIYLNASGVALLKPEDVDNGSTGFCGLLQYSLDKSQFTCANIGVNTVTLQVTDGSGNTSTGTASITVADNSSPVISGESVSPSSLWPADQKLITVNLTYTTSDNCGVPSAVLSVKSNEAESGLFNGDRSPDWKVISNKQVQLRAERSPTGTGRIYTITIAATDAQGNRFTKDVYVSVPLTQAATSVRTARELSPDTQIREASPLQLLVAPNPSNNHFLVSVNSSNNQPVSIRTLDVLGRVVERKNNMPANVNLKIGQQYRPGLYLVEATQAGKRVLLQLLKTAD